jgi:hypothetical protein
MASALSSRSLHTRRHYATLLSTIRETPDAELQNVESVASFVRAVAADGVTLTCDIKGADGFCYSGFLAYAALHSELALCKALIGYCDALCDRVDSSGRTTLHFACMRMFCTPRRAAGATLDTACNALVEWLLERDSVRNGINDCSNSGFSALRYATISAQSPALVKQLVAAGADALTYYWQMRDTGL